MKIMINDEDPIIRHDEKSVILTCNNCPIYNIRATENFFNCYEIHDVGWLKIKSWCPEIEKCINKKKGIT